MATVTIGGTEPTVKNLSLTSTDDIQVGFSQPVNTVIIKCRTAVDIQVRDSRNASEYFTIPSGQSLSMDLQGRVISGAVQPFNIWLRSSTGNVTAELVGLYGG